MIPGGRWVGRSDCHWRALVFDPTSPTHRGDIGCGRSGEVLSVDKNARSEFISKTVITRNVRSDFLDLGM